MSAGARAGACLAVVWMSAGLGGGAPPAAGPLPSASPASPASPAASASSAAPTAPPAAPARLEAEVVEVLPHDPAAFTEGLEVSGGYLYESSGWYGRSWVQRADPATGRPVRRVALPAEWFAEGLTVVGGRLWQLTWQEHTAVLRDAATLAELRRVRYDGEAWGLCHDRARGRLLMSDGSATLSVRDPDSFAPLGRITVRAGGRPLTGLNELECTGREVWANVMPTDDLARIDPVTGRVTAVLHVGELPGAPPGVRRPGTMNGVAADPAGDGLLVTGKYWPHVYRIRPRPAQ